MKSLYSFFHLVMKIFFIFTMLFILSLKSVANAAVLQVTSTADNPASPIPCLVTSNPNIYNCVTLRDAIITANSLPGKDTITFDQIDRNNPANNCTIATGDVNKICKITVASSAALPVITESIIINGEIAEGRPKIPGSVKNPIVYATKRPGVELSGELLPLSTTLRSGLTLSSAPDSVIKGLVINRFPGPGIFSYGNSSNTKIMGNYVGTDVTATIADTWNATNTVCVSPVCYGNRGQNPPATLANGYGILIGQGDNIQVGGNNKNERNVSSNNFAPGITLFEVTNSTIIGNFTGTDVYGLAAMGNRVEDLEIRGLEGAVRTAYGLLPSFGTDVGSNNNRIEYNIALDAKTRAGIRLLGREILFKTSAADLGVVIPSSISNTTVINNLSGINLAGQPKPSFQGGISLSDNVMNSRIGFEIVKGIVIPAPNTLANNPFAGIAETISPQRIVINGVGAGNSADLVKSFGNSILFNVIYNNLSGGSVGIDLAGSNLFNGDGLTANDAMDVDTGSNNLQNFPTLTEAKKDAWLPIVSIKGSLNSTPNTYFLLQFFANDSAKLKTVEVVQGMGPQPVIIAEGKKYLGSWIVKTDGSGNTSFVAWLLGTPNLLPSCSVDAAAAGKSCITATATHLDVNYAQDNWDHDPSISLTDTSEFSPAVILK